ncbi:MAG: protein-export chaperone SecB [Alphaproteobacteria bacterium]|jgi:preprotein translocase subunit SecB|nr:protein-export chaperone SecB [Alphaproteobacteria bacterium]MCB1551023.1 protein-export chaperone SecB [Alphaproteobacteria bacterium]MCB9985851.1 protein-export chaperone SecB [Micavibrio sp.]HPQ50161.1 protein-export chaperone SecB [Alphaproteobacteria bacterium]HRK97516.1 protein-export chaperone SecB [Alphaproteobacteria bacterium]
MNDQNNRPEMDPNSVTPSNLPVMVHAQYVKDLSFENPGAPFSLKATQEQPKMDVNITLDAKPLEDGQVKSLYEVSIRLSARAIRGEQTIYIAEVLYSIAASMPNVAEDHHHPLLLVEIPKLGFPFARKVLADLIQDGGYPPLLLGPVDFAAMYLERFAKKDEDKGVV